MAENHDLPFGKSIHQYFSKFVRPKTRFQNVVCALPSSCAQYSDMFDWQKIQNAVLLKNSPLCTWTTVKVNFGESSAHHFCKVQAPKKTVLQRCLCLDKAVCTIWRHIRLAKISERSFTKKTRPQSVYTKSTSGVKIDVKMCVGAEIWRATYLRTYTMACNVWGHFSRASWNFSCSKGRKSTNSLLITSQFTPTT